jgi:hypothetical protein
VVLWNWDEGNYGDYTQMKRRPKIYLNRGLTSMEVIVHFRKTKRACKFIGKLMKNPPRGVEKL